MISDTLVSKAPTSDDTQADVPWAKGAVSVSEAADFLGLSRRTIYELLTDGQLPSTKLRGRRLIPRASLLDLLSRADG